ncbi:MAG: PEP-CTERM sorting domain-containing protein [Verrucomicrobiota bacterium]
MQNAFRKTNLVLFATLWSMNNASASVDVTTTNRGSIDDFVFFAGYGEAYQVRATGSSGSRAEVTRNFHVFDLSNLSGTVTSATITFFHPGENGQGSTSYDSPDSSETITFFDVGSSSASDIASFTNALGVFADLGTGTSYGTLTTDSSVNTLDDSGTFQTITLNSDALASIQSSIDLGGDWLIGGSLTTWQPDGSQLPGGNPNANERIFRGSTSAAFANLPPTTLTLDGVVVPEPSLLTLFLGLGALGFSTVRRRRAGR